MAFRLPLHNYTNKNFTELPDKNSCSINQLWASIGVFIAAIGIKYSSYLSAICRHLNMLMATNNSMLYVG